MSNSIKYLLLLVSIWPTLIYVINDEILDAERSEDVSDFHTMVWNKSFGRADRLLDTLHTKIIEGSVARTIFGYTEPRCQVIQDYRVCEDIAGGVACAAMAYSWRHVVSGYVSWRNAAYCAGMLYFMNKLSPDWLKDAFSKIPLCGKLVDSHRFRNCRVSVPNLHGPYDQIYAEQSSSFALFEYVLGAGIIYGLRDYLSCDTIAKAALVLYLLNFISPKCKVIKIPILRRLLV